MSHSYSSEYPPNISVESGIKPFYEAFYQTSDSPEANEKYLDFFTEDATVVLASKKAVGREELLIMRKGMWIAVETRLHTVHKIFPFGAGADEVMIYGIVDYKFKDGRNTTVDWAARAKLVKEGGNWKMAYYQVYLDTAAMQSTK